MNRLVILNTARALEADARQRIQAARMLRELGGLSAEPAETFYRPNGGLNGNVTGGKTRRLSAAARKKISNAQKARWAKWHAAQPRMPLPHGVSRRKAA